MPSAKVILRDGRMEYVPMSSKEKPDALIFHFGQQYNHQGTEAPEGTPVYRIPRAQRGRNHDEPQGH